MRHIPFATPIFFLCLYLSASHSTPFPSLQLPATDTVPAVIEEPLRNPAILQGIWAAFGEDNATFIIKGKKITYPDSFKSYPFSLSKDTLIIQYDDFQGKYLARLHTKDTLILVGDEKQRFYRFKK
jgi:hypothetical protein